VSKFKALPISKVIDYLKNRNLSIVPETYTRVSDRADFICNKGHEFNSIVNNVLRGMECKKCRNEEKSLRMQRPLSYVIDKIKNKDIKIIGETYKGLNKKATFICLKDKSHIEWSTAPQHIISHDTGCPQCSREKMSSDFTLPLDKLQEKLVKRIDLKIIPETYTQVKNKSTFICTKDETHIWEAYTHNILQGRGCPFCSSYISKGEVELHNYIKKLYPSVNNARNIISPYELDIYIPEKNLAIEYNGLYWHSEVEKSPDYHFIKYEKCNQINIKLIQIYENEWKNKKDIVKRYISQTLNINVSLVSFNNLKMIKISDVVAKEFIKQNSFITNVLSNEYLGLYQADNLISILGCNINKDTLVINYIYVNLEYSTEGIFEYFYNNLIKTYRCIEYYQNLRILDLTPTHQFRFNNRIEMYDLTNLLNTYNYYENGSDNLYKIYHPGYNHYISETSGIITECGN